MLARCLQINKCPVFMLHTPDTLKRHLACHASAFRVDFGVYRGETIGPLEELSLGDVYRLNPSTEWTEVTAQADTAAFILDRAANIPDQTLTTLANLIFMTTDGRRVDIALSVSNGQTFLVCEQELTVGPEYVLIDIDKLDVEFEPALVPEPVELQPTHTTNVIALRVAG